MVKNPEQKHVTRDEQIEYLESQIQAYKARTSLLQQQQISTLDTLDEVLERHRRELDEESTAKRLLEQRLRRHRDILREVEKERDELRDAVLELIDRVEHSHNDFKLWPYSKLQLSSYTDPIAGVERPQNSSIHPSKVDEMQENLTYADGIIRALKHELHLERQTHAQMRARVHILEAQVASRDAALEAWAQRTGTSTPISVRTLNKNGKGKGLKKGKGLERDLDRAEISSLFIQTVSHNRLLEQEIRHLFSNLEKARSRAEAQSVLQSQPPLSSSPPPMLSKQPSREAATPRLLSPNRGRTRERKSSSHVPKEQPTHTRLHSSPQEPTGAAPLFHPQPTAGPSNPSAPLRLSSSRRRLSPSPQPRHATSHSPDKRTRQPQEPRQHRSHSLSRSGPQTPRPPTPGTVSSPNILQRFDNQIHLLSAQIDAFRGEREALLRAINSHLSARDGAAVVVVVDDTSYQSDDLPDQEGFVERHTSQTPRPPTPTTLPTNVLQRFDDQIHILSVQIDTFHAEREALIRIINSQLYAQGGPGAAVAVDDTSYQGGELFEQGESFTESEIEVGNVSETDYRSPAEHLVPDALVGEDEGGDGGGGGGGNGQEDEGTEGGERSMDLATPLFPVLMILPVVDLDSHSPPAHFPPTPLLPAGPAVTASSPSRNGSRRRSHSPAQSADPNDTHGAGLGDMDDDQIRMIRPRMRAGAPSPSPPP